MFKNSKGDIPVSRHSIVHASLIDIAAREKTVSNSFYKKLKKDDNLYSFT